MSATGINSRRTGTKGHVDGLDDILNVRRAGTTLGKKPGGDERLGKITWPAAHGLPSSERDVTRLLDEAARFAPAFGQWVDHFLGLADYISIRRQAGRA